MVLVRTSTVYTCTRTVQVLLVLSTVTLPVNYVLVMSTVRVLSTGKLKVPVPYCTYYEYSGRLPVQ